MTRLRHYRQAQGMSRARLAAKVHSDGAYIYQIENGTRTPSPWFAKLIADYFGVKVEAMFPDGVSEMTRKSKFRPQEPSYEPPLVVVNRLFVCPKCGASGFFNSCYACGKPLVVEEVIHA